MKKINFFVLSVVSIFLLTLSSCCDDDEEDYMVATFTYSCSPDLLEFVTPTVHYLDDNGVQKNISLNEEDFKTKSKGKTTVNLIINGDTTSITKDFIDNSWEFWKRYDCWDVKDKIWVTYELKDIVVDSNKKYLFYHGQFNYTWNVYSDGVLIHIYEKSSIPIETSVQGEANVRKYLSAVEASIVTLNVDLTVAEKNPANKPYK